MAVLGFLVLRKSISITGVRSLWACKVNETKQFTNVSQRAYCNSSNTECDEESEETIKIKILDASLKFVQNLGWSKEAISSGAESLGYPGIIHGMFPNGGAELVHHFNLVCNKDLNKILKEETLPVHTTSNEKDKTVKLYLHNALKTRMIMIIPYKKSWPQAMALMTLPHNVPTALTYLFTMIDDVCYYAGDRSVNINWYTRRVALAGIYKTTQLYMLQDSSEDHKETWQFLERRIEDAVQIDALCSFNTGAQQSDSFSQAINLMNATTKTIQNMFGFNPNR